MCVHRRVTEDTEKYVFMFTVDPSQIGFAFNGAGRLANIKGNLQSEFIIAQKVCF